MLKNSQYFAWSYPAQKFGAAVDTLTRSFAPGWQRMHWAIDSIYGMVPDHFPERDLYDRLDRLLAQVREFGPLEINGKIWRGSFENTLRRRKRVTLERYAAEIADIYSEILRRQGPYIE